MMFNHVMAKGGRLNEWIKVRLDECDRSPTSLADAMGVPQPRISELIAGKWQLPLDKAPAFARHLQISLEDAAHGFAFHELPNSDRPAPIDHTKPEIVQAVAHRLPFRMASSQRHRPPRLYRRETVSGLDLGYNRQA